MSRYAWRKWQLSRGALAGGILVLAMGVGACGKGDEGPTAPGGGGGGGSSLPATASEFSAIPASLLSAAAPAFTSFEFFGPFIAAALGAPAPSPAPMIPGRAATAPTATCFSAGFAGTTFEWNGTAYAASPTPGAPANGVRFTLYEIVAGAPTSTVVGHIDITCETVVGTALKDVGVSVVVGAAQVFSASGRVDPARADVAFSGMLTAPGAAATMQADVLLNSPSSNSSTVSLVGSVAGSQWQFSTFERDGSGGTSRLMTAYGLSLSPDLNVRLSWSMQVDLTGGLDGVLTSGTAVYDPDLSYTARQLAGCLSGTFSNVAVADATAGGCSVPDVPAVRFSAQSLGLIEAGYEALRKVHVALASVVKLAVEVSAAL